MPFTSDGLEQDWTDINHLCASSIAQLFGTMLCPTRCVKLREIKTDYTHLSDTYEITYIGYSSTIAFTNPPYLL